MSLDRIGEESINNFGSKMVIKEYRGCMDIDVYFPEYNWTFKHATYQSFKNGKIKCPYEPSIYGVGYLGEGKYKPTENGKLTDKYKIFKQRAEIFLSKDKKFCPEPDCQSFIEMKEGEDKYVQCELGHKYCYVCLKPWHVDKPCDEILDKDFQIWKKGKVIKQCPRCKFYTEKNEGCNHMTCSKCKYQFCWICGGKYYSNHFIHLFHLVVVMFYVLQWFPKQNQFHQNHQL